MTYITKERVKDWAAAALVRALKTFAQTLVAMLPVGASITEVGAPHMLGVAALAAVASVLTSIAGIPEIENGASLPDIAAGD